MGSEVQRLYSHHHTSLSKRLVRENRPLPHPHKPARNADLLGYARSVHDRRGRRVWNMVFGNYVAKPVFFLRGLRVFLALPNPKR